MKRHTRGSVLDFSINNDELEHDRRLLETRLSSKINIPAPPAASDEDDDYYHQSNSSSVEYPRHGSSPMPYPDFPSFVHRSREEDSHLQRGWSYRTGDDEDAVNPYGGETMSTVAHHASALTITAGLGGGRGARRDVSMSGAEYDPDRPLNQIIAGVGRMSMLDDPSKSKATANNITFEPLVVDSTAELDRILQSGFAPNRSVHPTPPMSRASSSTSSESEPGSPSTRPKLSDHLRSLTFSPKRPRTGAMSPPQQASPLAKRNRNASMLSNNTPNITPRPTRRVSNLAQTPEVRLQPPTPSTASSKFTRMARGINKEIAESQDAANKSRRPTHEPSPKATRVRKDHSKGRIVLPDVTGLTAAVESPARMGKDFHPYKGGASRDAEARLLQTLGQVQSKLQQLNEENGISRRRVRELEMELDDCKRDVVRERTRLLEKEDVIIQQQKEITNKAKGKAKAKDQAEEPEDILKRYKDAVEEKKALEALINSLRSHLTRLTSELASHQQLLQELRELRETDTRTLRDKSTDISRLKEEVERLAGEVEVLRGVVEEGLRERRAGKEASMQQSQADIGMSRDLEGPDSDESGDEEPAPRPRNPFPAPGESEASDDDDDSDFEPSSFASSRPIDRTSRTDHATMGSSPQAAHSTNATPHRVQFIDQLELDQIAAEVEERRSDRSMNESFNPLATSRSPSPELRSSALEPSFMYERPTTPVPPPVAARPSRAKPPAPVPQPVAARPQVQPLKSRPRGPAEVQQQQQQPRRSSGRKAPNPLAETPFPQIRGERLERLFFSAPEHNPETCTVCYRRRYSEGPHHHHHPSQERGQGAAMGRKRGVRATTNTHPEDEDEGFAENTDNDNEDVAREAYVRRRGKRGGEEEERVLVDKLLHDLEGVPSSAEYFKGVAVKAGLPPQTVAMRVIRELEDDFTHYKSVYCELADQYKDMDPVSDVPRRNMLAKHLREVVDILEQKGDQIASLSDLFSFRDKSRG